jgi:hypothetical protein
LLVGLLLSLALISEYPIVLVLFILFIYAVYVLPCARLLFWMLVGGTPLTLAMVLYNYVCFGTPLPVGYLYSPNYTAWHHTGLVSLTYPTLDRVWGITFSPYRGLFFLSPFLLLALPGFLRFWRAKEHRAEFCVCAASVVCFFLYNASSIMWWGGFAVGPRYLVPILPFLAVPVVFMFVHWNRPVFRTVMLLLIGLSIVLVWVETISGQSFPDFTPNPLLDFSLPRLLAGDIARNLGMLLNHSGWCSLIPLGFLVVSASLLLWLPSKHRRLQNLEAPIVEGEPV